MGFPAPLGWSAFGTPHRGDQASAVLSGQFTEPGISAPFAFYGYANFALFCLVVDTLTTTQDSSTATVAGPTTALLSPGVAISYPYFPAAATFATYAAGSGTIALQPINFYAYADLGSDIVHGNFPTRTFPFTPGVDIVGSEISGPGVAPGTVVAEVITQSNRPFGFTGAVVNPGDAIPAVNEAVIRLSNPIQPDTSGLPIKPNPWMFTLTPSSHLISSASNDAAFTGSTVAYTGSVQLEKSFDGGNTWIVANIGPPGSGAMAIYQNAACVYFSLFEPERQILYRWNCTTLTPVAGLSVQYRISETGSVNLSSALTR